MKNFKRKYFCERCGKELIVNPSRCTDCNWAKGRGFRGKK